jgi:hypothetical protein
MSNTIDSVTLSYTGLDLFEQAVRAIESHIAVLNERAARDYNEMADNAALNYQQKGVKTVDPMPDPPRVMEVEVSGRTISTRFGDAFVCPRRSYPEVQVVVAVDGKAVVGASMGDGKFAVGAGDGVPIGRTVMFEGKRYLKCGRFGFGGLPIQWYEVA